MIISSILSEVAQEIGADTTDTGLQAILLTCAKGALRRFPLFAKSRLLYITSYATLTAGTNYLTTPPYFLDEREVWYEDSGMKKIIHKKEDHEFALIVNTSASGNPEFYRIINNVIEFDKNAASDMVIYVEHLGEVDDVTATSNFFGSSDMLEILKSGTKATYYANYTESPAQGIYELNLFKAGLDALEQQYMIQQCGGHIGD